MVRLSIPPTGRNGRRIRLWSARARPRFGTARHVSQSESGVMPPHSKNEAGLDPILGAGSACHKKLAQPSPPHHSVCVHLAHLRLRDFRNYPRLDIDFAPGFHVLLGDNAQGKTNILESIYLMATLRSFRGVGGAQMIRHGQKGYFVGGKVVGRGTHEIKMYWSVSERQ